MSKFNIFFKIVKQYITLGLVYLLRNNLSLIAGNSILSNKGQKGQDISSVTRTRIHQAVDFGQSFAKNVSSTSTQIRSNTYSSKSPEFKHSQFSKPRKNVPEMNDIALTSAFAAKVIKSGK